MRLPTLLIALLIFAVSIPATAKVYSTRDGQGAAAIDEVLKAGQVLDESVTINGKPATLQVSICRDDLANLLMALRPILADARFAANTTSVLIETRAGDNQLIRYYLLNTGQAKRTLLFRMTLSHEAATAQPVWPASLPQPRMEHLETVMSFAKHKMVYATFTVSSTPAVFTRIYDNALRDAGWQPVSSAAGDHAGSTYVDAASGRVVMVSAGVGPGGTRASVVLSSLQAVRQE